MKKNEIILQDKIETAHSNMMTLLQKFQISQKRSKVKKKLLARSESSRVNQKRRQDRKLDLIGQLGHSELYQKEQVEIPVVDTIHAPDQSQTKS